MTRLWIYISGRISVGIFFHSLIYPIKLRIGVESIKFQGCKNENMKSVPEVLDNFSL